MAGKKKNLKMLRRAMRAAQRAHELATNTEDRVKKAVKKLSNNKYDFENLAGDLFAQWADVMKVVNQVAGASDEEVGTAYFVAGPYIQNQPPPPVPTDQVLVPLADMVDGASIEKTDLTGPVTFSKTNYQIIDPETGLAPVVGSEMDSLIVTVTALPPQVGTYHGVITSGNTQVLARIVYVYKT
jgi:hypothetical protein